MIRTDVSLNRRVAFRSGTGARQGVPDESHWAGGAAIFV